MWPGGFLTRDAARSMITAGSSWTSKSEQRSEAFMDDLRIGSRVT
jgi:hypothetical protein